MANFIHELMGIYNTNNKKYCNNVGTVRSKNRNHREAKLIFVAHIYMTTHTGIYKSN